MVISLKGHFEKSNILQPYVTALWSLSVEDDIFMF
jgi:hypothetical protein